MNNISNNNKNRLCSYIISTLPLNKKGILQQHQARERGQHHQQHQVGEMTTSSISSWNTDWRIKSSEVFFIGSIVILKGMQSSSASICISIKIIHHHHTARGWLIIIQDWLYVTVVKLEAQYSSCFTSQQSRWKQDTRLALHHSFSSWKHSTSLISMSCFTSQHLSWKQDTRLALRHNCQVRSTVLVSSHCLALRHNH
jgi:hypothetical protein